MLIKCEAKPLVAEPLVAEPLVVAPFVVKPLVTTDYERLEMREYIVKQTQTQNKAIKHG